MRIPSRLVIAWVVTSVATVSGAVLPGAASQQTFAQKYVTVVGLEGRPVTGLGSEDFSLRDGAVRRPVQGAEPAAAPLAIEIVLAGFDAEDAGSVTPALDEIRRALKTGAASHRVEIVEASGRPLVDAVLEAADSTSAAPTDRRVVVAIVRRRAGDGEIAHPERLTDGLRAARVSLWTLELGPVSAGGSAGAGRKPSSSPLDEALTMAVQFGGGLRETLSDAAALAEHARRVTSLLLSQYVVTYAWPDPMIGQFNISTRHDRGTVLMPVWDR